MPKGLLPTEALGVPVSADRRVSSSRSQFQNPQTVIAQLSLDQAAIDPQQIGDRVW